MLKKCIFLSLFILGTTLLPVFSLDMTSDNKDLKAKAYNVLSESLFNEKVHVNMKVDIFAIIAELLIGEGKLPDDRGVIEKFYQDVIVNSDKSAFAIDINTKKEDKKDVSGSEAPLIKDPEAIEILKKALKNDNVNMKIYALDIIAKAKLTDVLNDVMKMLDESNSDPELTSSIITTLGSIGNDSTVDVLEKYLSDENLKIKLNTIQALGEINSDKGNKILKTYLKNESLELALLAAGILANKGDEEALKLLKEGIESPVQLTVQKTMIAMTNVTNPKILPILKIASKSNDEVVKSYSLEILAKIDLPESVEIAKTMIDDKNLMPQALIAISQNISDEAFNVYSNAIQSSDTSEKSYVIAIMTQIKDKRVIPILKKALKDENPNISVGAAKILYTHSDLSGIPVLKQATSSNNPDLALSAAAFLGFTGDDYGKDILLNALNKETLPNWKQLDIAIILEKLGTTSIFNKLVDLLGYQKPKTLPRDLYPTTKTLKELLKQDSKWTRLNAAYMLTELKDYDCLPVIEELAQDQDLNIQTTAIRILSLIADKHSLPILAKQLNDEAVRVRVNSAEAIIKILNSQKEANKK